MRYRYLKIKHFYYSYLRFWIKYFTFRKLVNFFLNLYEYKQKKVFLKSFPSVVHIDVCNSCVLNCPLCATGNRDKSQTKAMIKFEDFKIIFDQVKDYIFFIWLYNWGEPFLCKDIFKIIDYCHQNNVGVKIDSNLNYYNDEILKNIVKSKIDYISLSIDGLSQEKYKFYRKNGDIKKVLLGINKIVEYKIKEKSKFPILVWQYLINNKNIDEVEVARKEAKKIGINIFEARPLGLFLEVDSKYLKANFQKYLSNTGISEEVAKNEKSSNPCRFLWCSLVVNPNLTCTPCPVIYKDSDNFLNLKDCNKILNVNSRVFIESRKLFINKNYKPNSHTPCFRCNWFTKA